MAAASWYFIREKQVVKFPSHKVNFDAQHPNNEHVALGFLPEEVYIARTGSKYHLLEQCEGGRVKTTSFKLCRHCLKHESAKYVDRLKENKGTN